MFGRSIELPIEGSGTLYALLSFAIAGFSTTVILGIHWCLGLPSHREQVSTTTHPSQGASR